MINKSDFLKFKNYFLTLPSLEQAGYFLWPSLAGNTLTIEETNLLKTIKPSGIIFFKRNLSSLQQAKSLISEILALVENRHKPFFKEFITSIDEEGGRVSRLPFAGARGKSALEFATTKDYEGLTSQILLQCFTAKGIGINCLLAPVADILTEPKNTVMGDRCYGYNALQVSEFASIVNQTLLAEKIWSCAKHFPGHGNTLTDSHKELSVSNVSLEELKQREWLPFKTLIKDNVPFIMAAHVLLPSIDAKNPATLSYKILTEQLKGELGFKGLILSDDLRMNAIALHYKVTKKQESSITEDSCHPGESRGPVPLEEETYLAQASIDSLNAGCDILLSCQSITREAIIATTIAQKLEKDKEFLEKMILKAWNIYKVLSSQV